MAYIAPHSASNMPNPPAMPPNQGKPESGLFGKVLEKFGDPSLGALPVGGIMGPALSGWTVALRSLSGRSALPTTENIAHLAGGVNAGGRGAEAARALYGHTVADLEKMNSLEAASKFGQMQKYVDEGARRVQLPELAPKNRYDVRKGVWDRGYNETNIQGGSVPPKDVLDRAMNNGGRDLLLNEKGRTSLLPLGLLTGTAVGTGGILGFAKTQAEQRQDPTGKHTLAGDILGTNYQGYKIRKDQ